MTLTIGRFTTQRDPATINHDGDSLSFGGMLFATSLDDLEIQRQQLLGLDGNEDEPDVPVTWTQDDGLDGYYTVKSVTVTPINAVTYNQFKFGYAIQLVRVQGGFAAPLCEVAVSAVLRTNGAGATAPSTAGGRVFIPQTASFRAARFSDGQVSHVFTTDNRVTATGPVLMAAFTPGISASFMSVTAAMSPVDYYDGSALIEQSVGGVWYPVVGDQIGNVAGNLLRVGNGLVRATFHTDGVISTEIFDGTVWESATSFSLVNDAAGTPKTWTAEGGWKILRNDPAACSVRTSAQFGTGQLPASVSLYVERGRMLVEVYVDNMFYALDQVTPDSAFTLQLRAATATAATALTGGIRQTSNNAQGHRWLMTSASAVTNDLVNGRITIAAQSASLIAQFGIGWELNGSAATALDTAALIAAEYFGVTGLRQRVVSR